MGCGRTGATLAGEFEARGHTVAIIDLVADAFRRLPNGFQGQRITGVGFDRDTLVAAGVEQAYAFAAVSDGDNSNIIAARVVRETYGVENVVARIADPGRAAVYRRLGIPTVAPVPWTATQIVTRLLPGGAENLYEDTSTGLVLRRLRFADSWVGRPVLDVEAGVKAHSRRRASPPWCAWVRRCSPAPTPCCRTATSCTRFSPRTTWPRLSVAFPRRRRT